VVRPWRRAWAGEEWGGSPPRGVGFNSAPPRDGPKHHGPVALRRRYIWPRAPVHQTQHHSPRTRVGSGRGGTTQGSSAPAAATTAVSPMPLLPLPLATAAVAATAAG
jgi:hypothetical protein